jgi:hypothetical protein
MDDNEIDALVEAYPQRQVVKVRFSRDDLDRMRQWFNSMEDTNPKFIEAGDRDLYARIMSALDLTRSARELQVARLDEMAGHIRDGSVPIDPKPCAFWRSK